MHTMTHPINNVGCDSEELKRITEFRVDRQAGKNGQFDFEVTERVRARLDAERKRAGSQDLRHLGRRFLFGLVCN